MPFVGRLVGMVVGVIVEMDEVGHDIDLVVDVTLSASRVSKTAEVDPDANVSRAMYDEPYESGFHPRGVDQELPPLPGASVRR